MLRAMNTCYVYILASRDHRHIAVRATADLKYGVRHHRRAISRRLARKNVYQKVVHVERFDGLPAAVGRERQMREWTRARLMHFVSKRNPCWKAISLRRYLARRRAAVSQGPRPNGI